MSILFLDDVPHNVPHDKLHNQKKTVTLGACFFFKKRALRIQGRTNRDGE
jgi:hypothetical protein